jgi:hypothetical protein
MHDLVIPLAVPLPVRGGEIVRARFRYDAGDSVLALMESIEAGAEPQSRSGCATVAP